MASIPDLWQLVAEAPEDIGPRLVLADALLEQGDPRGELIALQCRGADAKIFIRGGDSVEPGSERVNELIADYWNVWMDKLATVIVRQGSVFRNGMLALAQITDGARAFSIDPAAVHGHPELCALDRVVPYKITAESYAAFLAALDRDPPYVEVHAPLVVRMLRAKRERWNVRHVRFGGIAWWGRAGDEAGVIASEMLALSELSPALEVIEMPPTRRSGAELVSIAPRLPKLFPKLVRFRLEDTNSGWLDGVDHMLRQFPFIELV
jgi:uncharacterized protein (TIGR02996 family)